MDFLDQTNPVRILIVDDHPNTATMLARVLSKFDSPVDVITASSGEDALTKIGDRIVDILITDFMMPGMNGLELIEKLKGEQKPAHTILITAYDTPGLSFTARRLNVQDYLVKPVQPEKIRGIVARVLQELKPVRKQRTFNILIADDYPDNLRLLSTRLQSEGYNFIPAWDGEETMVKLRTEKPDLVLLDVNMPKKDGFQVLTEMRADPEIAHIPVIVITAARIGPKDVREGLTLGADDYVIKPFDWRELAARIRSKLRVKEAEDILRRRTRELGILPEIGQELSARLDLEELADVILNRTVEVLEAGSARLDVFQPDGGVFCRARLAAEAKPFSIEESREVAVQKGLAARVLDLRQGVIAEEITKDERWRSPGLDTGYDEMALSAVAVPLLGRQDVIGILTLTSRQVGFFNPEHQALLQAIASQAAIAIENVQLFSVEHKRVQELTALNQIAREINRFTYSTQLMDNLPRLIQDNLGYPVVAMWNGIARKPGPPASKGASAELRLCSIVGNARDIDPDILVAVPQEAATGAPIYISDPERSPSVMAVPVCLNETVRGVIVVYDMRSNAFQDGDHIMLETLATQVASALERVGMFESIEQEQRRLLAVLRSAADAILVMDAEMRLTLANPAGEQLFQDAESRVGQPMPSGEGYDDLIGLLDQVRQSGEHCQGEVSWPDGRTFSVLVTPVEEGGQVAVLHDVSNFMALAELKNEYIATASHDLKNPIMAVLGYSDLLAKAGPLSEMQADFSRRIRNSALQMRDLVLNLLEISRLESGVAMQQEVVDLHELLNVVAQELHEQVQAKGHTLTMDLCSGTDQMPEAGHPKVDGDRTLLQQMARNLLSNAIKYTPQGGEISLATRMDGDQIRVMVQDNGIGIPAGDLPYVFNKFYRVSTDATKDVEGTGLGLSIVKSIVENHGGVVAVDSVVDSGTTFTVTLPLAQKV